MPLVFIGSSALALGGRRRWHFRAGCARPVSQRAAAGQGGDRPRL